MNQQIPWYWFVLAPVLIVADYVIVGQCLIWFFRAFGWFIGPRFTGRLRSLCIRAAKGLVS